jgi:NAD(P)-dependent dehydrogenase (short-subunit alcohol dehydrogenase family)
MVRKLEGKVAIVTGGASGLGQAIAERFAAEGAGVLIADIDAERGQQVAAGIVQAGGQALSVRTDVTQAEDCERLVAHAVTQHGRLDIMVNNAGIGGGAAIAELPEALWDAILAVNLKGVFLGSKYAFRALARGGGGVILNMASVAGMTAAPGFAAYGAAKAGVIHLTKITALEGAEFNIRVNALCPVWIETPMVQAYLRQIQDPDLARREMISGIPLGRMGSPSDVAEAALFLASEAAAFITGVAFPIDGGTVAGARGSAADRRRDRPRKQGLE